MSAGLDRSIDNITEELHDRLRFSHGRLQETKNELAAVKAVAKKRLHAFADRNGHLEESLKAAKQKLKGKSAQLHDCQEAIKLHANREAQMKAQVQEREKGILNLQGQIADVASALQRDVQSRDLKINQQVEENKVLESKLENTSMEVQQIKKHMDSKIQSEEATMANLKGQLLAARKEVSSLTFQKNSLLHKLEDAERLRGENSILQQQLNMMRVSADHNNQCPCRFGSQSSYCCTSAEDGDTCEADTTPCCHSSEMALEACGMKFVQGETRSPQRQCLKNLCGGWVPVSVISASREMRQRCREKGIPVKDFDHFLLLLNDIYNQQECRKMAIATSRHKEIVKTLKRRIQHSEPYEHIVSTEKIRFLKKNLKECQKKWGPHFGECAEILQSVLRKVSCMGKQLERLRAENMELRGSTGEKMCLFKQPSPKEVFQRGAIWLSCQCLKALWEAEGRLIRELQGIHPVPTEQSNTDKSCHDTIMRLLDQVKSCFSDCRQKVSLFPTSEEASQAMEC